MKIRPQTKKSGLFQTANFGLQTDSLLFILFMFLHALKLFIVSYLIFAGLMFVLQRRLLYVPSKSRPSLQKFKGFWEEFRSQTRDGLTLVHWLSKRGAALCLGFSRQRGEY